MTNEDKILELLTTMNGQLINIETRLSNVEGHLSKVDSRLDGIENRLDKMDTRLDGVENRLSNVESQLNENTGMIRALTRAVEVASAKIEGLEVTAAKAESIADVHKKIDLLDSGLIVLNKRLFMQEREIEFLKSVK